MGIWEVKTDFNKLGPLLLEKLVPLAVYKNFFIEILANFFCDVFNEIILDIRDHLKTKVQLLKVNNEIRKQFFCCLYFIMYGGKVFTDCQRCL